MPLTDGLRCHAAKNYRGSEPLDQALADHFALVVEMPSWDQFSAQPQPFRITDSSG